MTLLFGALVEHSEVLTQDHKGRQLVVHLDAKARPWSSATPPRSRRLCPRRACRSGPAKQHWTITLTRCVLFLSFPKIRSGLDSRREAESRIIRADACILHSLGMFVADLFKPRCRLEAENLFLVINSASP